MKQPSWITVGYHSAQTVGYHCAECGATGENLVQNVERIWIKAEQRWEETDSHWQCAQCQDNDASVEQTTTKGEQA